VLDALETHLDARSRKSRTEIAHLRVDAAAGKRYDADFGGVSLALWLEAPSVRERGVARLKLNDRVVDLRNNKRQRAALADAAGAPRVDAVDCARFLHYHPIKTPRGLDAAHARARARRANASAGTERGSR